MIKSIVSPFQTPAAPGKLCVILDASFAPDLPTQVEHSLYGTERCIGLFAETRYAGLQSAGPFALLCSPSSALSEYASSLLERADAGCVAYLEDEQAFERAVAHWRSLLTVSTDETPAQMMRFFEPRWLEPLLNSLDETEFVQFMGPCTDMAWRNELGWRHQPHPRPDPHAEAQAPGWLHLSQERQTLMDQQRLKLRAERWAQDYQAVVPPSDSVAFVHGALLAAQQAGYLKQPEQERWLRLALNLGDGFWTRTPSREILAHEDLSLGDKLIELERL